MKSIDSKEKVLSIAKNELMIECVGKGVNRYKFLCVHPRNDNYVILMNFCERPVRFYYQDLINRFFTDYSDEDVILYKIGYRRNEIKELEEKLKNSKIYNNEKEGLYKKVSN